MDHIMDELMTAIEEGDLQVVNQLLERVLTNTMPDEQYGIAELFMQYGYFQEADKVLEHLQFLYPEEAQISIDRATVLMELGQEDDALDLLLSVQADAAEYPQALLVLADYYQMQGLYEVAEKHINEAMELLPTESLLQFAKAELLFETGRFTEAVRIYEELHEQGQTFAGVSLHERLAEVYRAGAAFEQALEHYMKALEDEVKPDVLFGSGYAAFQVQNYELAIQQLEDLKELDPDYFSAYLLLAESYAMLEDNKKALAVIEEGLVRDEYDKTFYLFAGKMALKNSDPSKAVQYLQEAIALDPEYMEAIHVLMAIYANEERYEDIISLYEHISSQDFDWTALYPFVAKAYDKEEEYEKAGEMYEAAYEDFKDDTNFLENYVYFLIEDGKREKAKELAERLVALEPAEDHWIELLQRFD